MCVLRGLNNILQEGGTGSEQHKLKKEWRGKWNNEKNKITNFQALTFVLSNK